MCVLSEDKHTFAVLTGAWGLFGAKREMDFANAAIRGGRTWEFRDGQVAEVLCAVAAQRPTVVTITVGANDFLRGDTNIVGVASRVTEGINRLLNNGTTFVTTAPLVEAVDVARSDRHRAFTRRHAVAQSHVVPALLDIDLGARRLVRNRETTWGGDAMS